MMGLADVTILCCVLLAATELARRLYKRRRLGTIRGPFLASLSNFYRFFRVIRGDAHLRDIALHRKYGNVVRLGPNVVSIGSPLAIPQIYGITAKHQKSDFYPVNQTYSRGRLIPGLFSTTDDKLHRHMKRPIAGLYSMSNVIGYEPLIDKTTELFISQIEEKFARTGERCSLSDWLQFYAFDVMGDVTFSRRLGFLEQGIDVEGMMEKIWHRFKYFAAVGQLPWLDILWDKSPVWNALLPQKSSPIVAFSASHSIRRLNGDPPQVREKSAEGARDTSTQDFLSGFIATKQKDISVPDWYVTAWTTSNLLAGSDTTAIYLRAVFYYLLKNKDSLNRLVAEILDLDSQGRLSNIISWKESKEMPFLDACIKEAGRLHPPIGLPLERVIAHGGINIEGVHIPEGTVVGINAWVVQRDLNVFGQDADDWRPERWLCEEQKRKEMERAMFVIELVKPNEEWIVENHWVAKQKAIDVYFRERHRV
ncbi:hypothetical protein TruAng_008062 [Truncatella angustata]|nr:hypothetical protein TruAng_008062 [Truncatella angustata]